MSEAKKPGLREKLRSKYKYVDRVFILFLLSLFQFFTYLPVIFHDGKVFPIQALLLVGYTFFEWAYVFVMHIVFKKVNFELEFIAFFLCGIGLCVSTSVSPGSIYTQLGAVVAGIIIYDILLWFLQDVNRVMKLRVPLAVFTLLFFAGCFLYIRLFVGQKHGAYNWLYIGGFSVQPAELVKIAFIFVGAASLDKLLTAKNSYLYIIFALGCIGIPVLMKDLGTALIFFFTFIIIAFMRSGDVRSILFICATAVVGAIILIALKPYVASRFTAYRHVWDDMDGRGYQQVRTLIYCVSGGLFGVGLGQGKLRDVFASTEDLVFGVVCEELGMIAAFSIVVCFAVIAIYAVVNSKSAPSTFYSIAACSAAALLLFQTSLNIFGITDLLPLTGVTLPFVSKGGSSMLCSWALFAFIKSADVRTYPKVFKNS